MKKVFLKTYGCQMNVYDSERIMESLSENGYKQTNNLNESDLIIFNTCHIREKAAEKLYSDIGRLKKIRKEKKIIVAGCVAQAEDKEIIQRMPEVDLVIGPQTYHKIPELVSKLNKKIKYVETDFPIENKFDLLKERVRSEKKPSAFLTIQEGCDKFCTFCVVPYTRGAEYSRTAKELVEETKQLLSQGVSEITLLGQNVNAYHGEGLNGGISNLANLIYELSKLAGLERIRYTTNHPVDVNQELIDAHRDIKKLMPYIHLPIQSGSNRILKLMNRKHTCEEYIEIIEKIRNARSDIALSSDFITGFPGETDKDFELTIDLVKKIKYAQAYSFNYSPRPGTPSADYEKQIPQNIKSERLKLLQDILKQQQLEFNDQSKGKIISILVERKGREINQLVGKTPYMQSVFFKNIENKSKIGDFVDVKIDTIKVNNLSGELVEYSR
ncbi:MAG: tRNA (N6-isopentenyl adenosine(37)-C2)-methylthiotransferase MiaB [Rhodobiaceae bacterium]|nr:tRNA (N6-isopentenyl adenosine(37)-C2)-methylthiotransferase MiaB [Rhodobiaceae bacterium]RPF97794.1 MAG: tRNA (N6-isopentenyl adenosine(37)-C2)-methylthiotransferase MiaB [Rhizobiales bacterium TMED227]